MEPGLAEVRVPKWFFVYKHLHTVHAIASCNAAEILRATARLNPPDFTALTDGVELVPVSMTDKAGTEVVHVAANVSVFGN